MRPDEHLERTTQGHGPCPGSTSLAGPNSIRPRRNTDPGGHPVRPNRRRRSPAGRSESLPAAVETALREFFDQSQADRRCRRRHVHRRRRRAGSVRPARRQAGAARVRLDGLAGRRWRPDRARRRRGAARLRGARIGPGVRARARRHHRLLPHPARAFPTVHVEFADRHRGGRMARRPRELRRSRRDPARRSRAGLGRRYGPRIRGRSPPPQARLAPVWSAMRTEVLGGQLLDISSEVPATSRSQPPCGSTGTRPPRTRSSARCTWAPPSPAPTGPDRRLPGLRHRHRHRVPAARRPARRVRRPGGHRANPPATTCARASGPCCSRWRCGAPTPATRRHREPAPRRHRHRPRPTTQVERAAHDRSPISARSTRSSAGSPSSPPAACAPSTRAPRRPRPSSTPARRWRCRHARRYGP